MRTRLRRRYATGILYYAHARRDQSAWRPGQRVFIAYTDAVEEGVIVERGTGDRNLKRVPLDPYVVRELTGPDAGSEGVMSGRTLFSDRMAAASYSAELHRKAMVD